MFLKNDKRIIALAMIMSLCLLVYSVSQHFLHKKLEELSESIPNPLEKPTKQPTEKTTMFAVIYRGYVKTERESQYQEYWKIIASYFVSQRRALGSTLHKAEDRMWIAYSRWPDKATRDASWPRDKERINAEIPTNIQEAIRGLKECLDKDRQFPEICMEIIEEVLK